MKNTSRATTDRPRRSRGLVDRLLAEQQLQNLRFDTAINNMSQGLCFFDGEQRLIVCNDLYAKMYKLTLDLVRPGTTLHEIVDHRFASGCCPETTPGEYMAWRESITVRLVASDTLVVLKDGRTIAIHHQPMPDGGWVSTHDDITESIRVAEALQRANEQLEQLAMHDSLTGLPNRRKFTERFAHEMARLGRTRIPPSLLMVDIDNFKAINDRYGHFAGDACLKALAGILADSLRQVDLAARFGGDEFVILLPESTVADSLVAAERICRRAEAKQVHLGDGLPAATITISVGSATAAHASDLDEILARADKAVYRAKRAGRNQVCL